jgi:hypothetical protein
MFPVSAFGPSKISIPDRPFVIECAVVEAEIEYRLPAIRPIDPPEIVGAEIEKNEQVNSVTVLVPPTPKLRLVN